MNLLFTTNYGQTNFNQLRQLGHTVNFVDEFAPAVPLTEQMKACDVLIGYNPFPKYPLSEFANLKYIQLASVGFNHIPIEEINQRNLPIYHNVGQTKYPIAEWIVFLLLNIYKLGRTYVNQQVDHVWLPHTKDQILEITGKTITFLGAGNIATETARKLKAFDAKTVALNLTDDAAPHIDQVYTMDHLKEILPQSDVVICCLPATKDTYHLLNQDTLSLMKDQSVLINISRGTVIDEKALCQLLEQNKFRGVGMDVFEQEPLTKDSPLWDFENVYITPHNAIESDLSHQRVFDMIFKNICLYDQGQTPLYPVHYERGF